MSFAYAGFSSKSPWTRVTGQDWPFPEGSTQVSISSSPRGSRARSSLPTWLSYEALPPTPALGCARRGGPCIVWGCRLPGSLS